jgi:RNA polymerase sigma-70 factor
MESREFIQRLFSIDLYLAMACASGNEASWRRFLALYSKHLRGVAWSFTANRSMANEIADGIAAHLFLPPRSGVSRIGSYDGRSSLRTWLRAIVKNRIMDEQALNANSFESLESFKDLPSTIDIPKIEQGIVHDRYAEIVADALRVAVSKLNEDERRLLVQKYLEARQTHAIAAAAGIHSRTLRRRIAQLHLKLREQIVSKLSFTLTDAAVRECIQSLLESPAGWVLNLLE